MVPKIDRGLSTLGQLSEMPEINFLILIEDPIDIDKMLC